MVAVRPACALLLAACAWSVDLAVLEEGSAAQATTLGNMELGQGRFESAIAHYQRALKADPTYFWARYNLGLAYQQANQLDQAKNWYEEALKIQGDHPDVLCNLGYLAFLEGRFADAAARFQEAARLSAGVPADAAQHWCNVGGAREKLGQWGAAGRAYQEAVSLNPRSFNAHFNLGTLYLSRLNEEAQAVERAQAHLQTAVEISPDRPEGWMNLAQCHELTGQGDPLDDYSAGLKAATGAYAGMVNQVLWQRALYHHRRVPPNATAMREDLKRILGDQPDFPAANGLLGSYFYALGEYDRAIVHLEREVAEGKDDKTNPIDLESHYLLAVIYADHKADPAKAIAHATAYYQVRPDSPKIHELRRRALRLSASAVDLPEATPAAEPAGKPGKAAAHGDGHDHAVPAPAHGPEARTAPAAHGAESSHGAPAAAAHGAAGSAVKSHDAHADHEAKPAAAPAHDAHH